MGRKSKHEEYLQRLGEGVIAGTDRGLKRPFSKITCNLNKMLTLSLWDSTALIKISTFMPNRLNCMRGWGVYRFVELLIVQWITVVHTCILTWHSKRGTNITFVCSGFPTSSCLYVFLWYPGYGGSRCGAYSECMFYNGLYWGLAKMAANWCLDNGEPFKLQKSEPRIPRQISWNSMIQLAG